VRLSGLENQRPQWATALILQGKQFHPSGNMSLTELQQLGCLHPLWRSWVLKPLKQHQVSNQNEDFRTKQKPLPGSRMIRLKHRSLHNGYRETYTRDHCLGKEQAQDHTKLPEQELWSEQKRKQPKRGIHTCMIKDH